VDRGVQYETHDEHELADQECPPGFSSLSTNAAEQSGSAWNALFAGRTLIESMAQRNLSDQTMPAAPLNSGYFFNSPVWQAANSPDADLSISAGSQANPFAMNGDRSIDMLMWQPTSAQSLQRNTNVRSQSNAFTLDSGYYTEMPLWQNLDSQSEEHRSAGFLSEAIWDGTKVAPPMPPRGYAFELNEEGNPWVEQDRAY